MNKKPRVKKRAVRVKAVKAVKAWALTRDGRISVWTVAPTRRDSEMARTHFHDRKSIPVLIYPRPLPPRTK